MATSLAALFPARPAVLHRWCREYADWPLHPTKGRSCRWRFRYPTLSRTDATRRCQRDDKAAFKITVKAFDFAFSLGTVRSAGAGFKTVILGQIQQSGIPPMLPVAKRIPFNHDTFGIIEQDMLRHATKEMQGLFNADEPIVLTLMLAKTHITGTAITQDSHKSFQFIAASTEGGKIHL